MANYRDDVNEIAVATDYVWAGIKTILESTGRGRDVLLTGLMLLTVEAAIGSDAVMDRVRTMVVETAHVQEVWTQSAHLKNTVVERGRGADKIIGRTRTWIEEAGRGSDELLGGTQHVVTEQARCSDTIIGQRHSVQAVVEQAKGKDVLIAIQRTLLVEAAHGGDLVMGRAHAKTLLVDAAAGADEVLDAVSARPAVLVETARANDEVFDQLHAINLVVDSQAVGWDELLTPGAVIGQAWTAEAGAWAMSRYAPFGFTGMAVIDGEVYATGPDGVYALDGDTEAMRAELRTGLMDMTGDVLALPVESHIEYELSGKAWVDVTQTQSGQPQTFSYPLKGRPQADVLTNARFEFGRGLRGRHFAYTLRLEGQSAYINDWSVLAMPSKRSL